MKRADSAEMMATLLGALALLALGGGCEDEDDRLDPAPFLGGWLPCLDEECSSVGTDGLAFDGDEWFHRIEATEEGLAPSEAAEGLEAGQRECCWRTTSEDVVIDYDDYYQRARIRMIDSTHMQVEALVTRDYDEELEAVVEVVCTEDEEFDPESWSWTPEACWTERWAPLGRAVRVLTPAQAAALPNQPPAE